MEAGSEEEEPPEEEEELGGGGGRLLSQKEAPGELVAPPLSAVAPPPAAQQPPIMQWEDLSLRIAELEKQEQQRRAVAESGEARGELWPAPAPPPWGEQDRRRRSHLTVTTSRFQNHKNLQLCFINNSDSEEEEGCNARVSTATASHASGLKEEVSVALRTRRDTLLAEQREREQLASSAVAKRKHLEHSELHNCSSQQLRTLEASLQQDIHELSSALVSELLVRDQLQTKQDAMLLDVQDLT